MNPEQQNPGFESFDPGHSYWLENLEGDGRQSLHFIKKEPRENGTLRLENDGTTNERVIKVLIDRMSYLNAQVPCLENEQVIRCLQDAVTILDQRMSDRKERGVFHTNKV